MLALFWQLVIAHAVTDYALQSLFMAEHKAPGSPPLDGEIVWPWILAAHALVNAGGVLAVTGSLPLSMLEAMLHGLVDYGKGRCAFGFHADQSLHIATKVLIAALATWS
ncbi:MAG: DUF3307 domain-containing protein [Amaricoccus sp.]